MASAYARLANQLRRERQATRVEADRYGHGGEVGNGDGGAWQHPAQVVVELGLSRQAGATTSFSLQREQRGRSLQLPARTVPRVSG